MDVSRGRVVAIGSRFLSGGASSAFTKGSHNLTSLPKLPNDPFIPLTAIAGSEVISASLCESAVFEMGQGECGFDGGADLARAGGEVPQSPPTPGEHGKPTFSQTTQASQQGVVGPVVSIEHLTACGLLDRGVHAHARPVVAAVGQRRQIKVGSGPVQGAEHVFPGAGQVVDRSGLDIRDHSGKPVGADSAWILRPCSWALQEYHRSICSPVTLVVFPLQRSAEKIFPSRT
jgi:hypothetical protein